MDKFLKQKATVVHSPSASEVQENVDNDTEMVPSKESRVEVILKNLPSDLALRPKISYYHPNDRDEVRRFYLQKSPCQPRNYDFPQRKFGKGYRQFNLVWFNQYGDWLEYSVTKDAAFCLYCYLVRPDIGSQAGGDAFVGDGFCNWKKKERLEGRIGGPNSFHNQARQNCQNLMNQKQHIEVVFSKQSDQVRAEYRTRLTASIDCIRFLLRQGLAFRGHNETEDSLNQGNFLGLLHFLAQHNEDINKVVLKNAPENLKLIAPRIQKDIVNAAANATIDAIIKDLGDEFFAILIDESRDFSFKEQMAVVLRYVDKMGYVIERFLGIVHVSDTAAVSLKVALESLFSKHGLSMSRLRGQGYDGASNMQGEFNGLKSLVMREVESAYYIHCFAHQLQLTLVAVAKNHISVASFFSLVTNLINIVGGSCKRRDMLRESRVAKLAEALEVGEVISGRGLKKAGDTRWGSHYGTLINLVCLFSSMGEVLDIIVERGLNSEQRAEACVLLDSIHCFDFAFNLHLMKSMLGITNELSQALQRKDQDIVNAMALVQVSKKRLQMLRDEGWAALFNEISAFCTKHGIDILNMDDMFAIRGRPRRRVEQMTNLHHYRVEVFYSVIDMQLQELNARFTEGKLICLAQFYPADFSSIELVVLDNQLENYIVDMHSSKEFSDLKGIGDLARKLVELKKDVMYPFVYKLVKLALTLPVATATVERVFLGMNIVKNRLRNRIGDEWMNDCLVTYVEKDVFDTIETETIVQRFQNMRTRRGQL